MATTDDVFNLVKKLSEQINSLEKKVALNGTEIAKLTAQMRIEQLRGERA